MKSREESMLNAGQVTLFSRVIAGLLCVGVLSLAGCGGSSTSDNPGGGTPTNPTDPTDPEEPVYTMGSFAGSVFNDDVIALGVTGTLSAGGSSSVRVSVVDQNGAAIPESVEVSFSSPCSIAGTASITSPISTVNGTAISTYTALGCVGTDLITATTTAEGSSLNASATITVAADGVQSIAVESVERETISLAGTGGLETSAITFQVLGSTGAPVAGIDVDFSLSTSTGGLSLTELTGVTDSDGLVSTVVQAGNVATTVRVTATVSASGISTQSGQLVVSTGLPDQDSMSLSASRFNPHGWNRDGETVTITARLSDAFNNPPPMGTAVNFTTEGGSIQPSCTTDASGACSVIWTSQNPRPGDSDGGGLDRAGLSTVLATAIGNESFIDVNGNGLFDDGIDTFNSVGCGGANVPSCDDLPEAYLDRNTIGDPLLIVPVRDAGESFVDFNSNGTYDLADGLYNGVLCQNPGGGSCTRDSVTIRQQLLLLMASNSIDITPESGTAIFPVGSEADFVIQDENGNSPPGGTTIEISGGFNAGCFVIDAPRELVVASDSINPFEWTNVIRKSTSTAPECTAMGSGVLEVVISVPNTVDLLSTYSVTWP